MTDKDIVQKTIEQNPEVRVAKGVVEESEVKIELKPILSGYRLSCFVPGVGNKVRYIDSEEEANKRFEGLKDKYEMT